MDWLRVWTLGILLYRLMERVRIMFMMINRGVTNGEEFNTESSVYAF